MISYMLVARTAEMNCVVALVHCMIRRRYITLVMFAGLFDVFATVGFPVFLYTNHFDFSREARRKFFNFRAQREEKFLILGRNAKIHSTGTFVKHVAKKYCAWLQEPPSKHLNFWFPLRIVPCVEHPYYTLAHFQKSPNEKRAIISPYKIKNFQSKARPNALTPVQTPGQEHPTFCASFRASSTTTTP